MLKRCSLLINVLELLSYIGSVRIIDLDGISKS